MRPLLWPIHVYLPCLKPLCLALLWTRAAMQGSSGTSPSHIPSAYLMQGSKDVNQSSPPCVPNLDESSSLKLQMAPARLLASPGTSIHASMQDPPGMQMHASSLVVQQLQQEVEELSVSWTCSVGSLLPVLACPPMLCSGGLKQLAVSRAC